MTWKPCWRTVLPEEHGRTLFSAITCQKKKKTGERGSGVGLRLGKENRVGPT